MTIPAHLHNNARKGRLLPDKGRLFANKRALLDKAPLVFENLSQFLERHVFHKVACVSSVLQFFSSFLGYSVPSVIPYIIYK